jgi:hypothetical protein
MHFISLTALNERILNDGLEQIWKEAVFNILSHHLPEGSYQNYKTFNENNQKRNASNVFTSAVTMRLSHFGSLLLLFLCPKGFMYVHFPCCGTRNMGNASHIGIGEKFSVAVILNFTPKPLI